MHDHRTKRPTSGYTTQPGPAGFARRVAAVALTALALLVAASCSGGGGQDEGASDSGQTGFAQDADEGAVTGGGGAGGGEELTATGEVVQATTPEPDPEAPDAQASRLQTFTATVDLGVEQLEDAVADAAAAVEALGGFAAEEEVDLAGSERATVVYRVPAAEFRPALDAIGDVGALRRQSIESEDVTAQYSDLEARVTTLRTSITRLQGFLSETTDVNQIASLESELTRREAELESIESQRRVLADQVSLSTITVTFDAARESERVADEDRPGFRGGLDAGQDAALALVAVVAATAGFVVPLLPLVALVVVIVWLVRRRRRRRSVGSDPASE